MSITNTNMSISSSYLELTRSLNGCSDQQVATDSKAQAIAPSRLLMMFATIEARNNTPGDVWVHEVSALLSNLVTGTLCVEALIGTHWKYKVELHTFPRASCRLICRQCCAKIRISCRLCISSA